MTDAENRRSERARSEGARPAGEGSTGDDLEFRAMEANDADLKLFHDCFVANGSPRSIAMLRWQYFTPPAGPLLVNLAITNTPDARLAAIYAVFPVYMRAGGKRVLAVQSLNTLTDVAFRGRGLFISMATALYERAAKIGVELVYGFPNGNSAHGIFKRLQWDSLDPLPVLIRPLRTGYVLRKVRAGFLARFFDFPLTFASSPKLASGLEFRTVRNFDDALSELWNVFATSVGFAIERDAQYLAWRLQRPGESYECFALYEHDQPIGLAIIGSTMSSDGSRVGKLMDYYFLPTHTFAGELVVAEAMHRLKARGCGVVWAWNFEHSANHAALRASGFFTMSAKLQGAEGHVGARAFTSLANIGDRKQWYISMLDSDTA
ncbi:MAG: GNAT family N-acetyltransferase [Gemmatimonadaceae bacterium]